jgi:protein SCO1/2
MTVWRLTIAGVVILGAGCGDGARTYQLTGQVLVIKPEAREVLVKHDDIPGFMPAMTMPYTVNTVAILRNLEPGDLIRAELTVARDGSHLSAIARTGTAPLPEDAPTRIPAAANVHILKKGDAVPDTPLTDQGKPLRLTDCKGSALAVTFIYTRCPLPQFCPLMDRRFAEVQQKVAGDRALAGKVRLLSISFDPRFDGDGTLKAHAAKAGANPRIWRFATTEEETVDRLAAEFGIDVIRERDGTITHNLRTAIVDPQGRIFAMLDDNNWTADDLARGLKEALSSH